MYIPSLRLTSYGDNKKEAQYMMSEVVIEAFFEDLFAMKKGQALNVLYNLGWSQNRIFGKKLNRSESYVDGGGILQEFNLPEETPIEEEFIMV